MPHHIEACRAAGIDDVVSKPISVSELFAAVSALSPNRGRAIADVVPLQRAS
jgi:DNA-binding response OmpR family regulator